MPIENTQAFFQDSKNIQKIKESICLPTLHGAIEEAFKHAVSLQTEHVDNAAVFFSGGIDSSLVAFAVSQRVKDTRLFSTGTKTSPAFKHAQEAAKALNLPLEFHIIDTEQIREAIPIVKKIINTDDFLQLQIAIPEYLGMKAIHEAGFKTVFCGQGADELFAGYDVFRAIFDQGEEAIRTMSWQKLERLWLDNLKRDFALAHYFKLDLRAPFLDSAFIQSAMALPVSQKIHSSQDRLRKHELRTLGKKLGLPDFITQQPKKAIQYDSGVSKELKKLLK
jgi:asparagine synthase (glutamine-hydrolysing)